MDDEQQNPDEDLDKLYEQYIKQDDELSKRDLSLDAIQNSPCNLIIAGQYRKSLHRI